MKYAELLHVELFLHTAGLTAVFTRQLKKLPCTEAAHGRSSSRPSHGPCDDDVPYVTAPCDDVVYEVPVLRASVHPGEPVDFWLLEEGVGNGEALL